jgi:hypothetical protein
MSINWCGSDVEVVLSTLHDNESSRQDIDVWTIGWLSLDRNGVSIQHVGAEILQIGGKRKVSLVALNRTFSGLFQEVIHRCKQLDLEDIYLEEPGAVRRYREKKGLPLVVRFGQQTQISSDLPPISVRVKEIADCIIALFDEISRYCSEAIKLVRVQSDVGAIHPVFFYTKRQAEGVVEDVVCVSSQRMGQFMVAFIDSYDLLLGRTLNLPGESLSLHPPVDLATAGMDCRAVTREQFWAEGVRVLSYEPTMDGLHVLTFPGHCLGLRVNVGRAVLHPDLVFTNAFEIAAIQGIKAKKLQDLGNREVDVAYRRIYRRFAYGRSFSTSALIERVEELRRLTKNSIRFQSDIHSLVQTALHRVLSSGW